MKCPFCCHNESKVLDTRQSDDGEKIRRRRECMCCCRRFTTYESLQVVPVIVVKKDGSREKFDRRKLFSAIARSCEKRPVSFEQINNAVDEIEFEIQNSGEKEVSFDSIGLLAMKKLKDIDEVSYIRFASVYRCFDGVNSFMDVLATQLGEKK